MPLRKTRNKRKSARSRKQRSKTIGKRRLRQLIGGPKVIGGTYDLTKHNTDPKLYTENNKPPIFIPPPVQNVQAQVQQNPPPVEEQVANNRAANEQGREETLRLLDQW